MTLMLKMQQEVGEIALMNIENQWLEHILSLNMNK